MIIFSEHTGGSLIAEMCEMPICKIDCDAICVASQSVIYDGKVCICRSELEYRFVIQVALTDGNRNACHSYVYRGGIGNCQFTFYQVVGHQGFR